MNFEKNVQSSKVLKIHHKKNCVGWDQESRKKKERNILKHFHLVFNKENRCICLIIYRNVGRCLICISQQKSKKRFICKSAVWRVAKFPTISIKWSRKSHQLKRLDFFFRIFQFFFATAEKKISSLYEMKS
jgi:hypothetical protein